MQMRDGTTARTLAGEYGCKHRVGRAKAFILKGFGPDPGVAVRGHVE
jgi:hypothetical protein